MEFVFGTYNFLQGGIDDGDTTRLHRQLRRLREHRARAWAFQECSNWESNGCLEAAEDALDTRGFMVRSTKNPGGNVAVFVKTSDHKVKVIRTRHEGLMHDKLEYVCDRNNTTLPKDTIVDHEVVANEDEDEDEDSDHRKVLTTFCLGDD